MTVAVLFNILFNATLSFFVGLGVTLLVIKLGRVEMSRWRLYFLSLPFAKVIYDTVRWIPADAYLWTGLDPAAVATKRTLSAWFGLNDFGPFLGAGVRAIDEAGRRYTVSFGDIAVSTLTDWATWLPGFVVSLVLSVSLIRMARRLYAWMTHEQQWRARLIGDSDADSEARIVRLRTARIHAREVPVYVAHVDDNQVPFAGGLLRPYVVLPRIIYDRLSPDERSAAIAHELAHIRYLDLPQTLVIELLADAFWFVPGYGWLKRQLEELRELLADQDAVREGADPLALSSALLTTRSLASSRVDQTVARPYSALVNPRSLLERRVRALTTPDAVPSRNIAGRALLALVATAAVLSSTIGGNHAMGSHDLFSRHLMLQLSEFFGALRVGNGAF